jgi:hypothetical protein
MRSIRQALSSVESLRRVDAPARALQHRLRRVLPDGPAIKALAGSWVGHPVHPILVLMPVGSWLSVGVLDLLPNQQSAARKLALTGVVSAVPALLTGAVEFRELDERQRRVGFVHALTNLAASGCYLTSYGLRRAGHTGGGKVWALLGLAAVGLGGSLGGHLTYAQGAGVFRWQAEEWRVTTPEAAPAEH